MKQLTKRANDLADKLDKKLSQAHAVIYLLGGPEVIETSSKGMISYALWAARDLIGQAEKTAEKLLDEVREVQVVQS